MDKSILTTFSTGKPIVLHAMAMKELSQLLDLIKGVES
jgi:hypothetical protein|tara:strand:+ start:1872 stop:1985 length:114 start_codon:yes stop_codon:yes gene_type:complete